MEIVNHEYFVSLEVAKLLKEAGFDWEIDTFYHRYYEGDGHDGCTPTEEFYFDINHTWIHDWNNDALTYAEKTGELVHLSAPTLDVAQRWLRKVKNVNVEVYVYIPMKNENNQKLDRYKFYIILTKNNPDNQISYLSELFTSYEEAQEAGIKKCLTLILEKR